MLCYLLLLIVIVHSARRDIASQYNDNGNYWAGAGMVTAHLFADRLMRETVCNRDVAKWLEELEEQELVKFYEADGKAYLHVEDVFKVIRKDVEEDVRYPIPVFQDKAKKREEARLAKEKKYEEDAAKMVDYFNLVTGKRIRHSEHSMRHAVARLRDGYTLNDLKIVIDHKTEEWLNNKAMQSYLRPLTLFGPRKFDGYLNAAKVWAAKKKGINIKEGVYQGLQGKDDYERSVRR